ncbi:MAG: hypothetical protein OEW98_02380 [Betaproteobacteria bacterium]|jgi:hypothetical protein|nr:hypothetical protein [Betaproteobacteria bacterium]
MTSKQKASILLALGVLSGVATRTPLAGRPALAARTSAVARVAPLIMADGLVADVFVCI